MELKRARLRRLTVWAPVAVLVLLVAIDSVLDYHSLSGLVYHLLTVVVIGSVGSYLFSHFVFSNIQRQEDEVIRRSEAMAAINTIGTGITEVLELEKTLHSAVGKAKEILDAEIAALCLMDERGCLAARVKSGPPEAFDIGTVKPNHPGAKACCVVEPMPISSNSEGGFVCSGIKQGFMKAHLAVPLRREGRVIGALCVADRSPRQFTPLEKELLSALATQVGIALENARLHERLQNMAVIEERQRIAREMHDGLAQNLGYLHLKFSHVEQALASKQLVESIAELKEMKRVTRETYEEVRQSILGLRSMVPPSSGLVPTLVEYLEHFREHTGIAVELKIADEAATRFSPQAEVQLVRIIQEALANVRKHSEAKRAWVTFGVEGGFAKILIRDDGVGCDMEARRRSSRPSFGLETMRERTEGIEGTFSFTTGPGRGTTVEVRLPLGAEKGVP